MARDALEIRMAGYRALTDALGHADAAVFLTQVASNKGNFTKERHERPEPSNEEIWAGIMRLQEEHIKAGKPYTQITQQKEAVA